MVHDFHSFARLRAWAGMALACFFLAGCDGGGGNPGTTSGTSGSDSVQPANPPIEGRWQVSVTIGGTPTAGVIVPAESVPTSESEVETTRLLRLLAETKFQGYITTVDTNTLRVVDADTDYTMVVNSVSVVDFSGCGNCGVGSNVSFQVTVNFTESGVFDGSPIPPRTASITMQVRYQRIS
jgi:hypothetical protein